jgi:hypothetical protein
MTFSQASLPHEFFTRFPWIQVSSDLAQTRLALFVQAGSSIPMPFLAILVFWLAIIFASFSLFSRLNPTLVAALLVFALSAAGALYLVLELNQPFAGLMQISSTPLRTALGPLGSIDGRKPSVTIASFEVLPDDHPYTAARSSLYDGANAHTKASAEIYVHI